MEAHHRGQNGEAEPIPMPVHHQNGYGHGHEPPKDVRNVMENKAEEAETHDNNKKNNTEEEVEEEKKVEDDGADACTTSSPSKGVEAEELRSENASKDAEVKKDKGHNPKEGGGKASSKGKEPANSNNKGTGRGSRSASSNGRENGKGSRGESKASRKGDGARSSDGNRSSETIGANGLPSMQRSKSTPSRRSAAEEEKPPVVEAFVERMERPSGGDVGAKLVALLTQWLEYREPALIAVKNFWLQLRTRVEFRVKQAWPSVRVWLLLVTRVMLMLSLLGLESGIRGFASLFRLGSAAHFLLLWCTVLNFSALAGFFNLLIALGLAVAAVFLVGYTPALALLGLYVAVVLWLYGSFWMTGAVMIIGGLLTYPVIWLLSFCHTSQKSRFLVWRFRCGLFAANQGRWAILITMSYAVYSAKVSCGWLGLILCLALAFVSSDVVLHFLNSDKEDKFSKAKSEYAPPPPQQKTSKGRASEGSMPNSEQFQANVDGARTSMGASTSGINEGDPLSAEEEVIRVLGCKDHYAVLGFARYDNFDVSSLKREYRKKAMLVHPDKNGGNEKAEEAFKRLQNAYEILLDAIKRKCYDDELRREEVLMNFRKHRHGAHWNGRSGSPDCGCRNSEDEGDEDVPADSRRIACRKCGNNHLWVSTEKTKPRARWCQECQDHHAAKDGDGWVEQSGQSFFFGIFQKVDVPHAYACADGMVYDVTEWVLCQGLKCPPNTHKPTFHVSTTGIGKSPTRGPRSAAKGSRPPFATDDFPFSESDNNMTEQEFFEWLQSAMASGAFSDLNGGVPSYPGKASSAAKPGATKTRGKRKKGKKQW